MKKTPTFNPIMDSHFRLQRPSAPLPTEEDFDPWRGNLDAQCAWRNFGELSLKQAQGLFMTAPGNYQEDFMFMGPVAFAYYFPVIYLYIREVRGSEKDGDDVTEVSILGSAVAWQLEWKGAGFSDELIGEIEDLAVYVVANVSQYSMAEKDQRRIRREWAGVESTVAALRARGEDGRRSDV